MSQTKNKKTYPVLQALLAAVLFGASAPLSKGLLGAIEPVPLAAFLYLGSGVGLCLVRLIERTAGKRKSTEAPLSRRDLPFLAGAILFGGVLAPILLMSGLRTTPASTASLLLNFECVATSVLAALFFKENMGKRVGVSIVLITGASILLSWNPTHTWGFSLGALGVLLACICWGIDNNLTRNISAKNPFSIVMIKGFAAGVFSLVLSFVVKQELPVGALILRAMAIGCVCYGLSTVLFVLAMRNMGSMRTSAVFAAAPFIGSAISFALFAEQPGTLFLFAVPILIIATILLLKEQHGHSHTHEQAVHEHRHTHCDGHHEHTHEGNCPGREEEHSHVHSHELVEHVHPHLPDIHHRHTHAH